MTAGDVLGESDWEDEDLLTHEEAGIRLREEIAATEAKVVGSGANPTTAQRAQIRLSAMRRRLERIDAALASGVGTVRRLGRSG